MNKSKLLKELVFEYQKNQNDETLNKIISLNTNLINWYLENTKTNLAKDEVYLAIIIGLIKGCLKYTQENELNIMSYLSSAIRINVNFRIKNYNMRNEILFENFLQIKELVEKRYGIKLEQDFTIYDDIILEMEERNLITKENYQKAYSKILNILKDYYASLRLLDSETSEDFTKYPFEFPIDRENFDSILRSILTSREYDIILSYFFDQETLEEIGNKYNINNSRVHQLKTRALNKLNTYFQNIDSYQKKMKKL